FCIILIHALVFSLLGQTSSLVYLNEEGKIIYKEDSKGNKIPDFSHVGYKNSEIAIPQVPIVKTVYPVSGDNYLNVKNAIDEVASMPIQPNGFRGAILFKEGLYEISETLYLKDISGVVIRGEGDNTVFRATAQKQYNLFHFTATNGKIERPLTQRKITDNYVPIGAKKINIENHNFKVGDWVHVKWISNDETWPALVKMDSLSYLSPTGVNWKGFNISYERKILRVDGNTLTLDAPIMDIIDAKYATGFVVGISEYRVQNCGIENIRTESQYQHSKDIDHGWVAVCFEFAKDCWVRNLNAYWFGFSCVEIAASSSFITVDNCKMIDPISPTSGGYKYPFIINGQRSLVKNCFTKGGRHDFANNGGLTAGPNVFYNCTGTQQYSDMGPHQRWSVGTLFDNITGDGIYGLNVQNRLTSGTGHGWSGTQMMFWNCNVKKIIIQNPPADYRNWAIGCVADLITHQGVMTVDEPLGVVESQGIHIVDIPSLFVSQLNERLKSGDRTYESVGRYSISDVETLKNDIESGIHDIYELISPGEYILTSTISPVKDIKIRAAKELATKPIIRMNTLNTSASSLSMFSPINSQITILLESVEINGSNNALGGAQPMLFYAHTNATYSKVIILDSYVHGFEGQGFIRFDVAGGEVEFKNTVFNDMACKLINYNYVVQHGSTSFDNCTFSNFFGESQIISFPYAGSKGVATNITHCTFHNSTSRLPLFQFGTMSEDVKIKNSLFTSIENGLEYPNVLFDSCYVAGFSTVPQGVITNSFQRLPEPDYANEANLYFGLSNKSLFICGNGKPAGNTIYYQNEPIFEQELKIGQYTSSEVSKLKSDIEAGKYDIYELTLEDNYIITTVIQPKKSFIIRAAKSLLTKPVIVASNSGAINMFNLLGQNIVAEFDGVEIDGRNTNNTGGNPVFLQVVNSASTNCRVNIKNSHLHHFENNCLKLYQTGTEVSIEKTIINDIYNTFLYFGNPIDFGSITFENCTFANFYNSRILYFPNANATVSSVYINHCTFHNYIASSSSIQFLTFRTVLNGIIIKNSVFTKIDNGLTLEDALIESSYVGGFGVAPRVFVQSLFSNAPQPLYFDEDNLNLGISNKASFICDDGLSAGNTMYYHEKLERPTLLTITDLSSNGFTVNWHEVKNADGYSLYLYKGEALHSIKLTDADITSYSFSQLAPNTTYRIGIIATSELDKFLNSDPTYLNSEVLTSTTLRGSKFSSAMPYVVDKTVHLPRVGDVEIYNLQGTLIVSAKQVVVIDTNLNTGYYLLKFTEESGNVSTTKIFVK
ncbi:MAG: T9SS type A sorting domain-containing protein, partial [Bacteroidales bacterium]|nr:T9SS type A sorting domain-containing protein [Bacteroidales bacterium]